MKNGAIYAYFDNTNPIYVGSVQDLSKLERRHKTHIREHKGLLGRWLRLNQHFDMPVVLESVEFESVAQLFERENYWMRRLNTLTTNGGLNQVYAGGPDHSTIGSIGSREDKARGGRRTCEIYGGVPGRTFESCQKGGLAGGSKGGKRRVELYGPPGDRESRSKGGLAQPHEAKLRGIYRRNEIHGNPATPESCSKAGKLSTSNHLRWHVRRGLMNPNCRFCQNG